MENDSDSDSIYSPVSVPDFLPARFKFAAEADPIYSPISPVSGPESLPERPQYGLDDDRIYPLFSRSQTFPARYTTSPTHVDQGQGGRQKSKPRDYSLLESEGKLHHVVDGDGTLHSPPGQDVPQAKIERDQLRHVASSDSIYRPLPGPDSLRIVILRPSIDINASLYCDMEVCALRDSPDYTALSYSWGMNQTGDDSRNRSIFISGHVKAISQNLFEGLRRLRSDTMPLRIWIDAVCINQNDIPERSAQVLRMAEIFAHASAVAVWLGENEGRGEDLVQGAILNCFGDPEYDHAKGTHIWPTAYSNHSIDFCAFRKVASWRKMKTTRRLTFDANTSVDSMDTKSVVEPTEYGDSDLEVMIQALDALFNRRYFKRRWILQELYHSPSEQTTIYFGSRSISLEKFASVCFASIKDSRSLRRFIVGSRKESSHDWKGVQYGLREVERVLRLAKDKEKTTFLEALERSSHLNCKDPRDVLFSLASLDPDFGVVPNYNLSTAEVYTSFAGLLIKKGLWQTVLDNLCNCKLPPDHSSDNAPSWVPDFLQGFVRSAYIQGLDVVDSEPTTTHHADEFCEAAMIDSRLLSCTFYAIGVLNFGAKPPGANLDTEDKPLDLESRRRKLQSSLCLQELTDVFQLEGTKPYEEASMGDVVCSPRAVYTTEEAVIVVLSPLDLNAGRFRIAQVRRGIDLSSLNGQSISELSHHAKLPESARFRAILS